MTIVNSSSYPRWMRVLVDSHLWIAIASSMSCLPAIIVLDFPEGWIPFFISLTAATFSAYNFHRIRLVPKSLPDPAIRKQRNIHFTLAAIGASFALWYGIQLSIHFFIACIPPFMLTTGYLVPISKGRRLRDLPYVKTVLLSVTFAYFQVVLPASLQAGIEVPPGWIFFFGGRCAYMFALCLPFDIRDMDKDSANGVITYANHLGIDLAKKLCEQVLIAGYLLLLTSFLLGLFTILQLLSWTLLYLVTFLFIKKIKKDREAYYYSGIGDGLMIVQAVIFIAAVLIEDPYIFLF